MSYIVRVRDNFRWVGEDATYERPPFETAEAALKYSRGVVDAFLEDALEQGVKPAELYQQFAMFGETPTLIEVDSPPVAFSGRDYAKQRCAEILAAARAASE